MQSISQPKSYKEHLYTITVKNFFLYIHNNERLRNIGVFVSLVYLFIKFYLLEGFLLIKNLKRDTKKYKIPFSSIVYNALLKYPLMGFLPSEFFLYKLYENSYKDYLTFFSFFRILCINRYAPFLLEDKLQFKVHISNKITTANLVASYDSHNKKITKYTNSRTDKVVIKPYRSAGGKGVRVVSSSRYPQVLKNYSSDCLVEDFIHQHHFLNEIFSDSLNTLRILTLKKNNEIVVIKAVLKVGRSITHNLDHMARGGICINIDMKSGMLLNGLSNYKHGHLEYVRHPETKYEFYKKTIPFFEETTELAKQAHRLFPMHHIIGWDIAITETGPCVVEGNRIPDLFIIQIFHPLKNELSPLLNSRP
ncbi:hypothetical protein AYK25_03530 [Thermoplasmatales archaeon SM1-50]|nr:MAG: hypothetical protein AYK25_03530 [Thermoplasmatales archaeon SM1-50]